MSGGISMTDVKLVPLDFYYRMTKGWVQDQDVLINKDGAQTGKVGYYRNTANTLVCINEHLFRLRGKSDLITQQYLYYLLLSQDGQNQIRARISGSAQPGLKSTFAERLSFVIPNSLPEQEKIADVLSQIDRSIEQTRRLIKKQQRIKRGLMSDLLTKGIDESGCLRSERMHQFKDSPMGKVPVEWDIERFEDITPKDSPIRYGIVQPGHYDYTGVKVAGIYTINSDFENWHMSSRRIEQSYAGSRIKPGDVLLSIKGSTGNVGVVPEGHEGNISREIARIRLREGINPYFVRFVMLSDLFQKYLANAEVGTTRAEISIKVLRKLYMCIPPLPEQTMIAVRVSSVEKVIEVYQHELDKLLLLKLALMQDLLTGRKRVTALLDNREAASP